MKDSLSLREVDPPSDNAEVDSPSKEVEHNLEPTTTAQSDDVPPNGGYGWVCVAAVFLINAHTWGINS